jgi:DNA-binding NtrC family response regulator
VDDERGIADTLAAILELAGFQAQATYGANKAMALLRDFEPALVITDVIMPEMNGVELATKIRDLYPRTKILLMSGNAVTQEILDDLKGQPFEIVAKPFPPRQMIAKVASLLSDAD